MVGWYRQVSVLVLSHRGFSSRDPISKFSRHLISTRRLEKLQLRSGSTAFNLNPQPFPSVLERCSGNENWSVRPMIMGLWEAIPGSLLAVGRGSTIHRVCPIMGNTAAGL